VLRLVRSSIRRYSRREVRMVSRRSVGIDCGIGVFEGDARLRVGRGR
jgi:hypothetical protein